MVERDVQVRRILIISRSPLHRDPRIQRQISALRSDYRLVCTGLTDPSRADVDFVPMLPFVYGWGWRLRNAWRILRGWTDGDYFRLPWVQRSLSDLADVEFDLILANDVTTLPLATRVARGRPVVYDAHEYAPGQFPRSTYQYWFLSRYFKRTLRDNLPHVTAMMTVSDGIARRYLEETGVTAKVVLNAPAYQELPPRPPSDGLIRLVHHGFASRARRLDTLAKAMKYLDDRYRLTFFLINKTTSRGSYRRLVRLAAGDDRIEFRSPVPTADIAGTLNEFDLGIVFFKPSTVNLRFGLPNKLFEFVQGRLAVVAGPDSSVGDFVQEQWLGRVADSYSPKSLADAIRSLDHDGIVVCKQNSDAIAKQFSAGPAMEKLLGIVDDAVSRGSMA